VFMMGYLIGEVKVARSVAQTATPSSAAPGNRRERGRSVRLSRLHDNAPRTDGDVKGGGDL